jgi:hypothetical protein
MGVPHMALDISCSFMPQKRETECNGTKVRIKQGFLLLINLYLPLIMPHKDLDAT